MSLRLEMALKCFDFDHIFPYKQAYKSMISLHYMTKLQH
ncbi:unnamed protein product [Paramecium octaurelia]|uniref:Uncharacterized protein n=1 Tax=Paramecium octaurelia TaxID=43137 RepID=A0A8S1YLW8_PAROT|nr:unnamed protein product [Paramecium octaurelia]CAD8212078.1 unnamed protein product [Paramecium octaurelia]